MHNSGDSRRENAELYRAVFGCLKIETERHTSVVPATRLRQGFAGVMTVGRRSFSEGVTQGPITTGISGCTKVVEQRLRTKGRGVWVAEPAIGPAIAGPVGSQGRHQIL
jgi:hypothetical protein